MRRVSLWILTLSLQLIVKVFGYPFPRQYLLCDTYRTDEMLTQTTVETPYYVPNGAAPPPTPAPTKTWHGVGRGERGSGGDGQGWMTGILVSSTSALELFDEDNKPQSAMIKHEIKQGCSFDYLLQNTLGRTSPYNARGSVG